MQTGKSKRRKKKTGSSAQLEIEAELLDTGSLAPKPGDSYIIPIMRYRVLKVVAGQYPHQYVFVGHDRPDLQSPQFRIGARHRMRLTRDFPEHSTILNGFEDESRDVGVFFCLSFDALN
jgi:hypothetical protein